MAAVVLGIAGAAAAVIAWYIHSRRTTVTSIAIPQPSATEFVAWQLVFSGMVCPL